MKTKNITNLFIALAIIMTAVSCTKDFLDVPPKGLDLETNYYKTQQQAYAGLVAVYDPIAINSGGFDNMVTFMNAGSDDAFGGGGLTETNNAIHFFASHTVTPVSMPGTFWTRNYQGIFRANTLLLKLPGVDMDATLKARYTAETKALRAYYYFNLVRMFKNIPLITVPLNPSEYYTITQADPSAVYDQIQKDLKEAKADLPNTLDLATEAGRFTKGSVQALLGKVYLYDSRDKKALAAAELAEVNGTPGGTSQYGYKLLTNYSDLWVVSNKFNTESILEITHSSAGKSDWGGASFGTEGNIVNIMVGPRSYVRSDASAPDVATGWSFNPITQGLYDVLKTDPRFAATILDVKALKDAGKVTYTPGLNDTGYFLNKFSPRNSDVFSGGGNFELNYAQDTYAIRLADTYLMEAEALGGNGARAQALLDAVRARVGLASTPVSLDAIAKERRLELAGEGHRWFDLVRTGKAATVLASRGFIAGKNEVLPIPLAETQNTAIIQNPGY
jgi:hypothetical protein